MNRKSLFKLTVVNSITAFRIALGIWALFNNISALQKMMVIDFCIIGDMIDGSLARAWRVQSKIGGLLDSTGDGILFLIIIPIIFFPINWNFKRLLIVGFFASLSYPLCYKAGESWKVLHAIISIFFLIVGAFAISAYQETWLLRIIGFAVATTIIGVTFTLRKQRVNYFRKEFKS